MSDPKNVTNKEDKKQRDGIELVIKLSPSEKDGIIQLALARFNFDKFKELVIALKEQSVTRQSLISFINNAYETMEVKYDGQLEFNFEEGN